MKKLFATGIVAALSMAVALPVFAEDGPSMPGPSETMSSSSSAMSSSNKMKTEKEGPGGMMKANKIEKVKKVKNERGNMPQNGKTITVDPACAQTAVAKRENALIAATDASAASLKTALTARRDALNAAWGQADAKTREAAIKAAHDVFKGARKTANMTLRTARNEALKSFKADAKTCKVSVPKVDTGAEMMDSQM